MKTSALTIYILSFCFLISSCKTEDKDKNKVQKQNESIDTQNSETFEVIENESIIEWKGSKPTGTHNGQIKIKSGEMKFANEKLSAGKFIIDMNSIHVMDLQGDEKDDLENHLRGTIDGKENHFFNVEKYPEALFVINQAQNKGENYKIKGDLTIKAIKNPIDFEAQIYFGDDNKAVKLISKEFTIDRTKWGIEFMSKSVFDDLKDEFIDDDISLKIILKAYK